MKVLKTTAALAVASCLALPVAGLAKSTPHKGPKHQAVATARVNINTANEAALESVVGLGAKKAKAIVTYRTKHGKFKSIAELDNVPGIGAKLLAKIKRQLIV